MKMGWRTQHFSYHQIYHLSYQLAAFLRKNGIKRHDKVLVLAPNSPYWLVVFWATIISGGIIVPLNSQTNKQLLKDISQQTKAKVIFKSIYQKVAVPSSLKSFIIEYLEDWLPKETEVSVPNLHFKPNDLAQLMYTSGTTGQPKGVKHTHQNLVYACQQLQSCVPIDQNDRLLSVLPLSHVFEQTVGFLLPFSRGARIIYVHSTSAIGELMNEYQITKMAGVPEFLQLVMNKIESKFTAYHLLPVLKTFRYIASLIPDYQVRRQLFNLIINKLSQKLDTVASGGSPLNSELEYKWNSMGVRLLQGYGMTETTALITGNTINEYKSGSVGKPYNGLEVKLGEGNEILVKGPSVTPGYFNNQSANHRLFDQQNFLKTGDIGNFDEDGFLFLKGRQKYLIKGPGGQNIHPEDIEEILNKFAAIKQSCVVGLPKGNQVDIHVVLILNGKLNQTEIKELIEQANQQLASFQQIADWSVWPEDDFPRSASRKIKKHLVEEKLIKQPPNKDNPSQGIDDHPIINILANLTSVPSSEIKPQTKLVSQLHLDSLLRIELIAKIEDDFGVTIDESHINHLTTVSGLKKLIQQGIPVQDKPRLAWWPRKSPAIFCRNILHKGLSFPLTKLLLTDFEIEGWENINQLSGPVIFMPNHVSHVDVPVLFMSLPEKFRLKTAVAAARDTMYGRHKKYAPFIELLYNMYPFPRKHDENIKLGLDFTGQLIDKGWSIMIFPEGNIRADGKFQGVKIGAGLLAVEMRVPVIPVKTLGCHHIWSINHSQPSRGAVKVIFGKPMNFSRSTDYRQAAEIIEKQIVNL